jgi:hypothetical protein
MTNLSDKINDLLFVGELSNKIYLTEKQEEYETKYYISINKPEFQLDDNDKDCLIKVNYNTFKAIETWKARYDKKNELIDELMSLIKDEIK